MQKSSLDIIKGISSDMDAMTNHFGGFHQDLALENEFEAPDPNTYGAYGAHGANDTIRKHDQLGGMKLQIVVDVAAGTAQVIDGDPAAAAGLEVLCHGRRMVVSSAFGFNDTSVKALADSRRAVRAPAWNQSLASATNSSVGLPIVNGVQGTDNRKHSNSKPQNVKHEFDQKLSPTQEAHRTPSALNSLPLRPENEFDQRLSSHEAHRISPSMGSLPSRHLENMRFESHSLSPPVSPGTSLFDIGGHHQPLRSSSAHGRIIHQAINVLLDDEDA